MCECQQDFYTDACVIPTLTTCYPQSYPPKVLSVSDRCAIFDLRPAEHEGPCRDLRGSQGRVEPSGSADDGHNYRGPHTDPLLQDFYAQFIPELRQFAPCGR